MEDRAKTSSKQKSNKAMLIITQRGGVFMYCGKFGLSLISEKTDDAIP